MIVIFPGVKQGKSGQCYLASLFENLLFVCLCDGV